MKLATLKSDDSRDGRLCVVSQDLKFACLANDIAPNLQNALDNWEKCEPKLKTLYQKLNNKESNEAFPFDPKALRAPLPRAYQWADGSAYVRHVALVRKARGAAMPESFWTDPLMYQGGSDNFIGPYDPIEVRSEAYGIDFEAEVAIITDDVPMGINVKDASKHIKLFLLVNDVSLRNLIPSEIAKGFGFYQSKPASAFSPVALTVDELGDHWHDSKIHLPLLSYLNNKLIGKPNAGVDMTFDFSQLIAHAAKTRHLAAGTIIGSGTVSNADEKSGCSCLAEKRMIEIIETGQAKTPFMRFGDEIRIEMIDDQGRNLFGSIHQKVIQYNTDANTL